MTRFTASFDTTSKVVSSIAIALLSVIALATHSFLATGIVAVILIATYAWSPAGYMISDQSLVVRRLVGDARFPLTGIRDVRVATPDDFSHCVRIFASGGLFGYYGVFSTSRLGRSKWYVTNRVKSVIVVTDSATAVFSPDDIPAFVAALRPLNTSK